MGGRIRVVIQASADDVSLEQRLNAVRDAMCARNTALGPNPEHRWFADEVHEDYTIARFGAKTYRVPYTFDAETCTVTFGEGVEVERTYVPVKVHSEVVASSRLVAAAGKERGTVWDVVLMEEGPSTTAVDVEGEMVQVYVAASFLETLVPLAEKGPVYALGDSPNGHKPRALKREEQMVGFTASARYQPGNGVQRGHTEARLHFNPAGELANERRTNLVAAWEAGNDRLFGLSIDADSEGEVRVIAGKKYYVAQRAVALASTDIVIRPGAGGRFVKLAASAAGDSHPEETGMKKQQRERLFAAIRASRPAALAAKDEAAVTDAELIGMATEAELQAAFAPEAPAAAPVTLTAADVALQIRARGQMERIVASAKLPPRTTERLQEMIDAPGATVESIQAATDSFREMLAEAAPQGVTGLGGTQRYGVEIVAGVEPYDRIEAAFGRSLGLEPEETALKTIRPLGLAELYHTVTCGLDESCYGVVQASAWRTIQAAGFDEDTLGSVLSNVINRRVLRDYGETLYGAENLVSTEGTAKDFKPQEAYNWGYLGNIPIVDTDTADYPLVNPYGEEKATYKLDERGFRVQITRKHLINDDLGHVAKLPDRIMRAGRRTVADYILDFLVLNPVIPLTPGTLTLFHATHNNLGSAVLGVPGLKLARLALSNQTEPSSGKKLGLHKTVDLHLWVPSDLMDRAEVLNNSPADPDIANAPIGSNPYYQKFGKDGERIHELYTATDVNDWVLSVDPKEREFLEMKYLNGQKVPQIVRQDQPGVGAVFTRGQIEMKAYWDFAGTPVDYRGVWKSMPA